MNVLIIGAGGVGWWVATGLAKTMPIGSQLTVADIDTMEGSGYSRLPTGRVFGRSFENMYKVDALKVFTEYVGSNAQFWPQTNRVAAEASLVAYDMVIDCTDASPRMRQQFKAHSSRYLRVSYDVVDNKVFAICSDVVPFSNDMETGGYVAAPSFSHAMMAGGLGAEIAQRLLVGEQIQLPVRIEIPYVTAPLAREVVELAGEAISA